MKQELNKLQQQHLLRDMREINSASGRVISINGTEYLSFSSNNYLGLAAHPAVKQAALDAVTRYGVGAGASRLVSGTTSLHKQLEQQLAAFKKTEAALVFPSGYMANVGVISALVKQGDAVILDRLNHASIIDGARLSGARIFVYAHTDCDALEKILRRCASYRRKLIVTDSVFSMDGDVAPLPEIVDLCERYNAMLMVDEAHAIGFLGATGSGAVEHFGLTGRVPLVVGTLSKAIGCSGGYIAADNDMITWLRNTARSFVYTTALPPAICAAALSSIKLIQNTPQLVQQLRDNSTCLRNKIQQAGYDIGKSSTQIIPVLLQDPQSALALSQKFEDAHIFVPAIRPPTIPKNSSRIRFSVMAQHTQIDLERVVRVLKSL